MSAREDDGGYRYDDGPKPRVGENEDREVSGARS